MLRESRGKVYQNFGGIFTTTTTTRQRKMSSNNDRSSSRSNNRKKQVCSPSMKDSAMFPWNWADEARNIQLSPPTTCESPDEVGKQSLRRGRPRADSITGLILKGSTSPSAIKCQICNRVFPRDKSLQAHLRTHTGERPYRCDFPGCERAFTQSGQLKTHQRLHTGEKPFVCSAEGCNNSFAHANRHCSDHPFATLNRVQEEMIDTIKTQNENNLEVLKWLEKYQQAKACKQPVKLRDRKLKRELDEQAILDNIDNRPVKITRMDSDQNFSSNPDDEWLGALALIQLAQTGDNQPLNLSFQK